MSDEPFDLRSRLGDLSSGKVAAIGFGVLWVSGSIALIVGYALPPIACLATLGGVTLMGLALVPRWFGTTVVKSTRMALLALSGTLTMCTCAGAFAGRTTEAASLAMPPDPSPSPGLVGEGDHDDALLPESNTGSVEAAPTVPTPSAPSGELQEMIVPFPEGVAPYTRSGQASGRVPCEYGVEPADVSSHTFTVTGAGARVQLDAVSPTDLTMVLTGPNAFLQCNDDGGEDNNPRIATFLLPGEYRALIGTYGENRSAAYRFTLSEVESSVPDVGSASGSQELTQLLAHATDVQSFKEIVDRSAWALHARRTRTCDREVEPDLDTPPGDDEFARRANEARRDDLRSSVLGRIVRLHGSGNVGGGNDLSISDALELIRGEYDFSRHQYPFTLRADDYSEWPVDRQRPSFGVESFTEEVERVVGSLGGRELRVRGSATDVEYYNVSRMRFTVPVDEEAAASAVDTMNVSVDVVYRFDGLGYHKVCQRSCDTMFGIRVCGADNVGRGTHYLATLLAVRVSYGAEQPYEQITSTGRRMAADLASGSAE